MAKVWVEHEFSILFSCGPQHHVYSSSACESSAKARDILHCWIKSLAKNDILYDGIIGLAKLLERYAACVQHSPVGINTYKSVRRLCGTGPHQLLSSE